MRLILTSACYRRLLTYPVLAQEQRGAIEGTVQDAQRAVIPGATVAALNLGQDAAVSDGRQCDRHVPISRPYSGVLRRHGLSVRIHRAQVRARGSPPRTDQAALLRARDCGESPRGSRLRASPLVDTHQSARVFSLRQDTIDLLPKGRDFTTLVSQAPGANQEPKLGGISIDGSSASENRFVVNGVETTNLLTGVSGHARPAGVRG